MPVNTEFAAMKERHLARVPAAAALCVAVCVAQFNLSGCSSLGAAADGNIADTTADTARIRAAMQSPERLAGDAADDTRRRAYEVLEALGAGEGMRVMDAFSAGGYYTELLSRTVGPTGEVIAYNNPPYAAFATKRIAERYAGGRLPNVRQITAPIEDLSLAPESLDAAMFVMAYHDLYWRPADGSWPNTDPALLLRKLYAAMKHGGNVLIQDHVANAGGDTSDVVNRLHRIDPAIVRRDFAAAGFIEVRASNLFANAADDHSRLVFDPAIQGRTDQFLIIFRKPVRGER
jgi:predicted methyltransferase